jgi:hypothetical protein
VYLIDIKGVVVIVRLHHKARTPLDDIIEHMPEGELRASFVGLPAVRVFLAVPSIFKD